MFFRPAHRSVHIVAGAEGIRALYSLNDVRHLMTAEGKQSVTLNAGMMVVVPQNTWHQFEAPDGVCVMTATPQPTEHLRVDVEDPRTAE